MKFSVSSIEMTNFRQYRATQKLHFTLDKSRNVSIIYGRNGSGKSNILNAITWCLYGKEIHKKNEAAGPDGMPTINSEELDALENGQRSYAEVKLHLQTDSGAWLVSRRMEGGKNDSGDLWSGESKLSVTHPVGINDKVDEGEGTKILINNLLPDALKSFFFIDGEQLREFFKISSPQEIAKAIDTVSQLELVSEATKHLKLLDKDLSKNVKATTPELEKIKSRQEFVQSQIDRFEAQEYEINTLKQNDELALEEVKNYLKNHSVERIRHLESTRQMLEAEKSRLEGEIYRGTLEKNGYLVEIAPFILLKKPIEQTYTLIKDSLDKGELPPKIRETFVRELIDRGVCICGNELTDKSRATLEQYSKHLSLSELSEVAIVGKTTIEEIQSKIEEYPQKIASMNETIITKENRLEEVERDIDQIGKDIDAFEYKEVMRYEARREELRTLIVEHKKELTWLERQKAEAKNILEKCQQAEQRELAKYAKYDSLRRKLAIARETQKVFSETEKIIKDKIRAQVERTTRHNFLKLIRKEGAFEDVTIDEAYTVKVKHSHGYNVINDLSAGEYLILGLAFMSALMNISGFQAPVIIDTPLGKIDDIHRKYITTELPQFLHGTQLILLVTPTEYDEKVKANLSTFLLPNNCFKIEENETYTTSKVMRCDNAQ